jgi:hypothetical protein
MYHRCKTILQALLITCFTILLLACSSKLTQENFDKIHPDMTMNEVVAILGEPTSSQSLNIAGISGTSATWSKNNIEINIQFLNNKVTVKSFRKPKSEQPPREGPPPDIDE